VYATASRCSSEVTPAGRTPPDLAAVEEEDARLGVAARTWRSFGAMMRGRALEGGRSFREVARELGVNHETLRNWLLLLTKLRMPSERTRPAESDNNGAGLLDAMTAMAGPRRHGLRWGTPPQTGLFCSPRVTQPSRGRECAAWPTSTPFSSTAQWLLSRCPPSRAPLRLRPGERRYRVHPPDDDRRRATSDAVCSDRARFKLIRHLRR
jgi:hypothetical protein